MRPLRFLLSLITCVAAFLLLVYAGPWQSSEGFVEQDFGESAGIRTYFNWRSPSSLFPPSAIISLTDDNSTFFLARPAAFGPLLPTKSLSGQLWIGSGFEDDRLGRGWMADSQGELGCSDIPDWIGGTRWTGATTGKKMTGDAKGGLDPEGTGIRKRSILVEANDGHAEYQEEHSKEEDGTDDHLHHPLSASGGLRTNGQAMGNTKKPAHADIQSIQEGAEIAGKIVLLSRGGCGFLEKVKWVQRRGGVALIVGDDIRGGPLVTMYARGDTSNVTIPALFTSHTTAHLLTTLIPSGGALDELSPEDLIHLDEAIRHRMEGVRSGDDKSSIIDKHASTSSDAASDARADSKHEMFTKVHEAGSEPNHEVVDTPTVGGNNGWMDKIFRGKTFNQRMRSSGTLTGDILNRDSKEDLNQKSRTSAKKITAAKTAALLEKPRPDGIWEDGFIIGVQDWRDPDLLVKPSPDTSSSSDAARHTENTQKVGSEGGSITPGSGEYVKSTHKQADAVSPGSSRHDAHISQEHDQASDRTTKPWYSHFWSSEQGNTRSPEVHTLTTKAQFGVSPVHAGTSGTSSIHEGLWVTLSPTSMSSSPFFDTLLVLVVSPLVTLTVVYALLLLRSRIRRRRWRAPKSVVERLPVRTYQTLPSSSSASSSSTASTTPSVTTPLLPSVTRPIDTTSRPRSRTTSEVPTPSRASVPSMASPSLRQTEEKRAAGLAEWRRRYGGKQRECVVCLEEYVDGLTSTPWLTTRRRTCPICKGDVVRSLARHAEAPSSSITQDHYQDASDEESAVHTAEDIQEQAATTTNDDPSSAQPVSRDDEAFEDLERGVNRTR
nr:er degradation-enhancing alpha-mannosidase-like protein 3 [Quercus suber]